MTAPPARHALPRAPEDGGRVARKRRKI